MTDLSSPPTVSVVVPVHNGGDDLDRCLAAISRSEWPVHECIIVDDGSTDGRAAKIDEGRHVHVVKMDKQRGPAVARNKGADEASGDILFFTAADVVLHPDAIGLAARTLSTDQDTAALIGSYDDEPGHPSFLSRYRNLYHHWNHQNAREEASTFWTGCGAIRRDVFLSIGGFDDAYDKPSIEDIELGYRLRAAGYRIRLLKNMLGTHMKQWTLWDIVRTDIFRRGVPWFVLLRRFDEVPRDLNLNWRAQAATLFAVFFILSVFLLLPGHALSLAPLPWLILPFVLTAAIVWLQRDFFRLLFRLHGIRYAAAAVPMQLLFFIGCAVSIPLGYIQSLMGRLRAGGQGK